MTPRPGGGPERALLLCFHNHQPVGNFDFVLEEAAERSYKPFLETLARFPTVRVTLHYSGFLLEWLSERRPDVVSLLRELVARGQVELLGGGMYEPVLALIPERDRQGQLAALSAAVRSLAGRAPEGIWLAERVWEPDLPATLAAAGVKYLALDDYHFVRAGLSTEELDGVYLTEWNGAALRVFPGSEMLRYRIPFAPVEAALEAIDRLTSREVPWPAAVFADDGEKFGVWPGTHRSVYEDGWLARFFEGIAARSDRLATMTFGEYVAAAPVRGRVYLPTCSYIEMGEWALPPDKAERFGRLLHEFRAGRSLDLKPFVQGGYYRNFLRKYDEANQLQKRMLWVSGRVADAEREGEGGAARVFLYRAQCNDVYWHGVFGGLYLNHLREAAYGNLLRAEAAADAALRRGSDGWAEAVTGDLDADGGDEVLLRTGRLVLFAHPHDGGALTEISLPSRGVALGHVLTRREEGYHGAFRSAGGEHDGSKSIHDVIVLKDPSVLAALAKDRWQRASFREALYRGDEPDDRILREEAEPLCATAGRAASWSVERAGTRIALVQDLVLDAGGAPIRLRKSLEAAGDGERFVASYRIVNEGKAPVETRFVSEWNLNFLSGAGPDRRYEGAGENDALSSPGRTGGLLDFRVVDAWRGVSVGVVADRQFTFLRYPVETASLSEAGAEKIHQGVCLKLAFPAFLRPGVAESYSLAWSIISVSR